jgi:hypothetical protein
MKPKLLLCLALVLSCGLFGCSTAHRSATVGQTKLIGRWTVEGTDDVVTLAEGNSASLKSGGKDSAGSYFIQTNLLLLTLTLHDKASPSERRFVQYLISPGTWSSRILQRVYIDPDTSRMFIQ